MKRAMTFEEFLKSKQGSGETQVDWDARKQAWLTDVKQLFTAIKTWLKSEERQGLLTIEESQLSLREEYVGEYEVPELLLKIGAEAIQLIPRGTVILGAMGRIDMRGFEDEVMIIREKEGTWKFAYRDDDRLSMEEVNEKTLKEWIQKVS